MDTLSGSVSTLQVHGHNSTSRELYHFKTTSSTSILPYSASKPNLISNKTTSFTPKAFTPIFLSPSSTLSFTSSSSSSSPTLHQKPASGYAAALLCIAQSSGSIDLVEKDVQRLLKLLRNKQVQAVLTHPLVGEKQKGLLVIDEVANYKGMFHKHLVSLVKMLVRKNKASLIEQVLEEFERIYDELSGTKVVLVSSAKKMKEDQLSKIAMSVQRLTGAVKVKYNEILGKGASKIVYKAFDDYEGIEIAWNQVKLYDFLQNLDDLERLYCEIHLLKTLKHRNIMKFYTSWVDAGNRNIKFVTKMFTSGTLRQYRLKYRRVKIRAVKHCCR